jgi:hypothetical protein
MEDERLSTRDIASPSGADRDTEPERDTALADAPPADTAAVPPERTDPDYDDDRDDAGAVAVDRRDPVGDGDVVTDEPADDSTAGRGPSRDSIADATAGGGDADDRPTAEAAAAAPAAAAAAGTGTATDDRRADDTAADDTAAATNRTDTEPGRSDDAEPLLADAGGFQARWEEIQVRFVDEPRGAVEDADALVATVMQRLAEGFAQERERLEAQWGRGEDISTEDLRVALQRYRSFFQRLLST